MRQHVDRIKHDSYGITTYLENLRRGQYQIPTFQRDVVWDRDRVKKLWDSIRALVYVQHHGAGSRVAGS